MRERGEGALTALVQSASRARRRFGGYVVHLGIVMLANRNFPIPDRITAAHAVLEALAAQ